MACVSSEEVLSSLSFHIFSVGILFWKLLNYRVTSVDDGQI